MRGTQTSTKNKQNKHKTGRALTDLLTTNSCAVKSRSLPLLNKKTSTCFSSLSEVKLDQTSLVLGKLELSKLFLFDTQV